MTDDEIKKLKDIIKDEVRPVKELVEVIGQKVREVSAEQSFTTTQMRAIRDQSSVMNEKLDSHTASLVTIEDTLKGYGDMYKVNKEKTEDLDERVGVIEDHLGLTPQK